MVIPRLLLALICFYGALPLRAAAAEPWPLPPEAWFLDRIPPPCPPGSEEDKKDLKESQYVQARATPEQVAHANATSNFSVFTFSEVLGTRFSEPAYPQTAAFFRRLEATANGPKNFLKETFRRTRPFLAHPDTVRRLVPNEGGFSYPSGHATRSRLYARVLGELAASKRGALLECGDQVAMDRVVGGMHYRNDILASWKLGDLIFQELMKEPEFIAALSNLTKAEWATRVPAASGATGTPSRQGFAACCSAARGN